MIDPRPTDRACLNERQSLRIGGAPQRRGRKSETRNRDRGDGAEQVFENLRCETNTRVRSKSGMGECHAMSDGRHAI